MLRDYPDTQATRDVMLCDMENAYRQMQMKRKPKVAKIIAAKTAAIHNRNRPNTKWSPSQLPFFILLVVKLK